VFNCLLVQCLPYPTLSQSLINASLILLLLFSMNLTYRDFQRICQNVRFYTKFSTMLDILEWGVVIPSPNPPAIRPHCNSCLWLLIQLPSTYRDLSWEHAMVLWHLTAHILRTRYNAMVLNTYTEVLYLNW